MRKFKYIADDATQPHKQPCAVSGCPHAGEHKAPRSPATPRDYQWLCVGHVRVFNKQWDYFRGMSQEEIEAFQKDAVTGHRPTWRMNQADKYSVDALQDAIHRFTGEMSPSRRSTPPLNHKDKCALSDLDMEHPVSEQDIKRQYKKLVKKYHPDCNQGDKDAEERFKQITASYNHLMQRYVGSI